MPKFTENEILRFLGKLANKWGTGHESITKILTKVENFLEDKSEKLQFLDKVRLFVSMLKDHSDEKYYIDDNSLGLIIATLAYLVLPTDLVPDFIPVVGFTDDAAAFALAVQQLSSEVKSYKAWKEKQNEDIIDLPIEEE
ncbi:YkvA family protein [Halanaerobacter jeridensis]|uniref:Uncharacterized membrane protein YkvA (DUF1232 family) n=1 Tax=Halanaerobacter jeridensis TaxID=706427 RepID=A0A938XVI3_9FIRM|nr:YkvA family protein [Halanaerobacter jeridensis]MBM7556367.1 uncharacterized membrane protein YkvA (DUF1232 family) [Halanaerobacter jeridensis]